MESVFKELKSDRAKELPDLFPYYFQPAKQATAARDFDSRTVFIGGEKANGRLYPDETEVLVVFRTGDNLCLHAYNFSLNMALVSAHYGRGQVWVFSDTYLVRGGSMDRGVLEIHRLNNPNTWPGEE